MKHQELDEVRWQAAEFKEHNRNELWFIAVSLLCFAGLALAFYFRDYLLFAVVLLIFIAIIRTNQLKPKHSLIKINNRGVYWQNKLHGYHCFTSFSIIERAGKLDLFLFRPNFQYPIHLEPPRQLLSKAVNILIQKLPQVNRRQPITDKLADLLKI